MLCCVYAGRMQIVNADANVCSLAGHSGPPPSSCSWTPLVGRLFTVIVLVEAKLREQQQHSVPNLNYKVLPLSTTAAVPPDIAGSKRNRGTPACVSTLRCSIRPAQHVGTARRRTQIYTNLPTGKMKSLRPLELHPDDSPLNCQPLEIFVFHGG